MTLPCGYGHPRPARNKVQKSVCHEHGRELYVGRARGCGAVRKMKVWPFGAALRGEASNHHMLRWLKTVVVSDVEKAHVMRQVGTRKTVRSPW